MRVCYGLVGMTRGHAARALAIGQELLDRGHEVLFCTEGDAEELLSARFGRERVLKTSTPKYYLKNGRLSIWRTVFGNRKYLYGRRKLAKPLLAHLQEWKPDITISDYEPLMWQASKVLKIPHVAVNSQEFFISSPLPKGLSLAHRIQAKAGGMIVRRFSPTADLRIVGKILVEKRPKSKAVFVGAILRKEFDNLTWQPQGEHFVVYSCPMLEQSLAGINRIAQREQKRGKVFGVPASMVEGYDWLDHQPTSETGFLTAVCSADFTIATPGNQFMAETLLLGLPVLMTPTPKQFEQEINAKMQLQARPHQYAMFHADAQIPDPSMAHNDATDASGRSKTVDLIEALLTQ
ncbi:hypothetical protein N9E21_04220 [Candidatus Poseidoniaceae archaeon]|nr:hypothetical protein [Candidatus Poseidoniaceae archaeon]